MKITIALAFLIGALAVQGQSWTNRYDGIAHGKEQAAALAMDKAGNVFVAATSEGADSFVPDFVLIKYSSSGSPLWVNRYTKYNKEITNPGIMSVDPEGNLLVVGSSTWDVLPDKHLMLMKVSSNGARLWTNIIGAEITYVYSYIELGAQGAFTVINSSNLVMYSAAGQAIATNVFDYAGTINDQVTMPFKTYDLDGNFIVCVFDGLGCTTVKYSSNGTLLWLRKFASHRNNEAALPTRVATDVNNNILLNASLTFDPVLPVTNQAIVKYSATGTALWTNVHNLNGGAVAADSAGNVLVGGIAGVAKYSASGALLWKNTNEQAAFDSALYYPQQFKVDSANNIIVSAVKPNSTAELVLIKYSASGAELWKRRQSLPVYTNAVPIVAPFDVDALGNGFVALTSQPGVNDTDLLTMRFVPPSLLSINLLPGFVVLGWDNPVLVLQSSASVLGPFADIPGATSPYTNATSGTASYFKLRP